MINKAILVGNVGESPVLRANNGTVTLKFSFATSKKRDKDGVKTEITQWHSIVLFGKLADLYAEIIRKGMLLYLEGEIRYDTYQKGGETKYWTEIAVDNVRILNRPANSGAAKAEIPY